MLSRKLLLILSLTTTFSVFAHESPCLLTGTIKSVKSGNWSDPATWGGKVPIATDTPNILAGHIINFDTPTTSVAGININCDGVLQFDSSKSSTLQSSKNFILSGTLRMRPSSAQTVHTLKFINIDESKFVGGGMDPLETDVGLWVMGMGQLDLEGTPKTSWLNSLDGLNSGATSIDFPSTISGWNPNDEIVVSPTESPLNSTYQQFDESIVSSVSSTNIKLSKSLSKNHPKVMNKWTPEVMNLTRNVRIEGTPTGKSHVFIHASKPQNIKYSSFRYMGPRKDTSGDGIKDFVLGRYAVHFHHSLEGSRGVVIEGNVVRDTDSHSFVPHGSHGITLKDNIAYNVTETPYWWDEGEVSHDSVWDHNIAALVKYVNRSIKGNGDITIAMSAYMLGVGDNNNIKNCVAVGVIAGDEHDEGAYEWQANNEGVWAFNNNIGHNNGTALTVWQNTGNNHLIGGYQAYHNQLGIFHGAYVNSFKYHDNILYGNIMPIQLKASANNSSGVILENVLIDGAGMADYGIETLTPSVDGAVPTMLRNVTIKNVKKASIHHMTGEFHKSLDIIHSNLQAPEFLLESDIGAREVIRVQPLSGQAYKLVRADLPGTSLNSLWNAKVTPIPNFAPNSWGTGKGLLGEYYNEPDFSQLAFRRTDSNIMFGEWTSSGVDYRINDTTYAVRWTGLVQAQYTEAYKFHVGAGGAVRLKIGGKVVLDKFASDNYPDEWASIPVAMTAGSKYDIELEFFNEDAKSGIMLEWSSPSQTQQIIPMSQLYVSSTAPSDPIVTQPQTNPAPTSNAGVDQTIYLPQNSVQLSGTASDDGSIASYLWVVKSGAAATIVSPNSAQTMVKDLNEGTYIFGLNVTDNLGEKGYDEVVIKVLPQVINKPPVASAGVNKTITLPTNSVTLQGSGSDADGSIVSYAWSKVSGGSATISTPNAATTIVNGLVKGSYVFRLTVTDNYGAQASSDVTVTVNDTVTTTPITGLSVNAGPDQTIRSNKVTINGTATDTSGKIVSYKWVKLAGPSARFIGANTKSALSVKLGKRGTYQFRVTVKNDKGATAFDDVTINFTK